MPQRAHGTFPLKSYPNLCSAWRQCLQRTSSECQTLFLVFRRTFLPFIAFISFPFHTILFPRKILQFFFKFGYQILPSSGTCARVRARTDAHMCARVVHPAQGCLAPTHGKPHKIRGPKTPGRRSWETSPARRRQRCMPSTPLPHSSLTRL